MINVGFDLLYLLEGETGGRETYACELIPALFAVEPSLTATAFVNREASVGFVRNLDTSMRVVRVPVSARRPEQWGLGEVACLPVAGRRAAVQIVHSLANFGPAYGRFRRVLTVHDLQYRALPELLPWTRRVGTSALMSLAIRRADRVITVSEFARDELLEAFAPDSNRVEVIPNGVGARSAARPITERALRTRHRLGPRPVALTVATNLPHKNLELLWESLALIEPTRRPVLMLAGRGTDSPTLAAQAAARDVEADVRLLGYVSPAELEGLYIAAACVVLPTLYEGFGLPALEAMARSVPAICSDIPAFREVAGDAALWFSPKSAQDLAAAIQRLLDDAGLAQRLVAAGRERVQHFSWVRAARATLNCYRRALDFTPA